MPTFVACPGCGIKLGVRYQATVRIAAINEWL